MPAGRAGPFFNDEFGDTFGIIYAFTSDGYSYSELHDYVEDIRRELLRVPDVGKADILGDQDEKVYIEMSHKKLATLGIDPLQIFAVLQNQNTMVPAGSFETRARPHLLARERRFQIGGKHPRDRHPGQWPSVPAWATSLTYTAATSIRRCSNSAIRGEEALGLAVSMRKGGDIIALGKALDARDGAHQGQSAGRHRGASGRRSAQGRLRAQSTNSCAPWAKR